VGSSQRYFQAGSKPCRRPVRGLDRKCQAQVTGASLLADTVIIALEERTKSSRKFVTNWLEKALHKKLFGCRLAMQVASTLQNHTVQNTMADVIRDAQQEFWRPPVICDIANQEITVSDVVPTMAEACSRCGTEFLLGSRFCHSCGAHRPEKGKASMLSTGTPALAREFVSQKMAWLQSVTADLSRYRFSKYRIAVPSWLRYLHFHEIKRSIGLPMPSLIAFMIGLGCVLGMLGVSLFYRASTLAEFQAIQMWRIEWLLSAIASFVAGMLLKNPSDE